MNDGEDPQRGDGPAGEPIEVGLPAAPGTERDHGRGEDGDAYESPDRRTRTVDDRKHPDARPGPDRVGDHLRVPADRLEDDVGAGTADRAQVFGPPRERDRPSAEPEEERKGDIDREQRAASAEERGPGLVTAEREHQRR